MAFTLRPDRPIVERPTLPAASSKTVTALLRGDDDQAVDLTGDTVTIEVHNLAREELHVKERAEIVDNQAGKVSYVFDPFETNAAGTFGIRFIVNADTNSEVKYPGVGYLAMDITGRSSETNNSLMRQAKTAGTTAEWAKDQAVAAAAGVEVQTAKQWVDVPGELETGVNAPSDGAVGMVWEGTPARWQPYVYDSGSDSWSKKNGPVASLDDTGEIHGQPQFRNSTMAAVLSRTPSPNMIREVEGYGSAGDGGGGTLIYEPNNTDVPDGGMCLLPDANRGQVTTPEELNGAVDGNNKTFTTDNSPVIPGDLLQGGGGQTSKTTVTATIAGVEETFVWDGVFAGGTETTTGDNGTSADCTYSTGTIVLGSAPDAGTDVTATYEYASSSGRVTRQTDVEYYRPEWWGAGIGVDDHLALMRACHHAEDGAVVRLAPKTYTITETFPSGGERLNVTLEGSAYQTIDGFIIPVTKIDVSGIGSGNYGIDTSNSKMSLRRIVIDGQEQSVSGWKHRQNAVQHEHVSIIGCMEDGLLVEHKNYEVVFNNLAIRNCGKDAGYNALRFYCDTDGQEIALVTFTDSYIVRNHNDQIRFEVRGEGYMNNIIFYNTRTHYEASSTQENNTFFFDNHRGNDAFLRNILVNGGSFHRSHNAHIKTNGPIGRVEFIGCDFLVNTGEGETLMDVDPNNAADISVFLASKGRLVRPSGDGFQVEDPDGNVFMHTNNDRLTLNERPLTKSHIYGVGTQANGGSDYNFSFRENLLAFANQDYTVTASEAPDGNSLDDIFDGDHRVGASWGNSTTTFPVTITIEDFGTINDARYLWVYFIDQYEPDDGYKIEYYNGSWNTLVDTDSEPDSLLKITNFEVSSLTKVRYTFKSGSGGLSLRIAGLGLSALAQPLDKTSYFAPRDDGRFFGAVASDTGLTVGGNSVVGARLSAIGQLSQSISSPPTQTEVQNIQTAVNDIIDAMGASSGHGLTED